MKYIITAEEAKIIEQTIIKEYVSSLSLIETVGKQIANRIEQLYPNKKHILVCTGSGGNGADGYVIATSLLERGYDVDIYMHYQPILEETKILKERFPKQVLNSFIDKSYDIIIDSLFGIGLNRPLSSNDIKLIEEINKTNSLKISVDVPSGLNGTNGNLYPISIKANITFTVQYEKTGLYLNDGIDSTGIIEVVSLGNYDVLKPNIIRLEQEDIKKFFPKRKRNTNKGTYGRTLITGGSASFCGAPYLSYSALCSLLGGSGYATLCIPASLYSIYALKNPEVTLEKMPDEDGNMVFNEEKIAKLLSFKTIVFGMGLGTKHNIFLILSYLLQHYKGILIIDADGLNVLAINNALDLLYNKTCDVVLTPHLVEFSRLLSVSKLCNNNIKQLKENEISIAKEFAREYKVTLVLKSAVTFITNGFKNYLNITGTPAMAKAGTGDTLAGLMGGIISSLDEEIITKCAIACYVMGKAGEEAAISLNEYSILASDIIKMIPKVIKE